MTYVSGNRGFQPSNSPSAPNRQKLGQRQGSQTVGQNAQPVRFGGNPVHNAVNNGFQRFVNLTLPSFENITEVFIWGFLAQDVIAMWLPRIYALLTEGRKKYDPKDDPETKNKPFRTQLRKYIKGNLEGLNWDNFYEGTKREFATGPGLLMVPAGLFLATNRLVNPSVKLSFPAAKGMGKGLRDQLDKHKNADADKLNTAEGKAAYRAQVKAYVKSIFQDPLFEEKASELKFKTSGDLGGWVNKWVDNYFCTEKNDKKRIAQELSEELQTTIRQFNREHRMEPYRASEDGAKVSRLIEDAHPLHRTESTWISYQPEQMLKKLTEVDPKTGQPIPEAMRLAKAEKRLKQMPVTEVLRDLTRMEGLVKGIEKKAADSGKPAEAAEQVMQRVIKMKFGISLGATAITAAYLTKLAFWAQNHNTYQATRLLNEKTAQNHGSRTAEAGSARSNRAGQQQSITPVAGSANALQPAFSMAGALPGKPLAQPFARPAQAPAVSPFVFPYLQRNPRMDERGNA